MPSIPQKLILHIKMQNLKVKIKDSTMNAIRKT